MRRLLTLLVAVPLLAACPKEGLVDSTWSEECPEGNPAITWIHLREDGTFDYSYAGLGRWEYDSGETWRELEDGRLEIAWNDRYAVTTYELNKKMRVLQGTTTKTCTQGIRLKRAR